jgi:hypothetical protein
MAPTLAVLKRALMGWGATPMASVLGCVRVGRRRNGDPMARTFTLLEETKGNRRYDWVAP